MGHTAKGKLKKIGSLWLKQQKPKMKTYTVFPVIATIGDQRVASENQRKTISLGKISYLSSSYRNENLLKKLKLLKTQLILHQ